MANKINIDNYEAFLLDYMEGNISSDDLVALQIFAAQHPHLNIDLNDLELVELETEKISFGGKDNLKKISDEQFVAYIENELTAEQKKNMDALCASNSSLAKDLQLYKRTIVSADANIVFENKNQLKKQETKVIWFFSREVLAAAASLILIAGLWFIFKGNLGGTDLNSEKLKGNSTIKTFALKSTATAPSYTVEKRNDKIMNNNPVAYSKTVEVSPEKENEPLLTNNTPKENTPKETIAPNIVKENTPESEPVKVAASNTTSSKQYIITEKAFDEDEKVASADNPKKGFWNKAMNALNGLNKLGVKKAKGTETVETNNEQYVLTLGNFKVENHKYNAE